MGIFCFTLTDNYRLISQKKSVSQKIPYRLLYLGLCDIICTVISAPFKELSSFVCYNERKTKAGMEMKLKKFLSLMLAAPMLMTSAAVPTINAADSANMSATADELLDEITMGFNMGNSLDCYLSWGGFGNMPPSTYETAWGNSVITEEMILKIKETGINTIRIPVTWYQNMDSNNVVNSDWMARVTEVVNYVIDNGMYCVVNVHHDTNSGWMKASESNYNANSEKFAKLWEQIAENFKDYDEHLIFEGYNELLDESGNWSYTSSDAIAAANKYNQLFVDTVRASGGNNAERCLILNTYASGITDNILSGFELPNDTAENKLIAEIHTYTPYPFCSSDFSGVTDYDYEAVSSMMKNLKTYFVDNDIPVIVGEFGCADKNNLSQRISYVDLFTKTAAAYGIKCFWWDNGDDFKLFDRNNLSWKTPEVLSVMLSNCGIEWNEKDGLISTNAQIPGDANNDSEINIADLVSLQRYILGVSAEGGTDVNRDGRVDVFDMVSLRQFMTKSYLYIESANWTANNENTSVSLAGSVIETVIPADNAAHSFDYTGFAFENGKSYEIEFIYQAQPNCDFTVSITDGTDTVFSQKISASLNEASFSAKFNAGTNAEKLVCRFEVNGTDEKTDLVIQDFAIS